MCGHDHRLCRHFTAVRHGCRANQLPHRRVLIDVQALCKAADELQGMKLGLVVHPDSASHRKGKWKMLHKVPVEAQLFHGRQLLFQLSSLFQRIDIGIFFLKITVHTRTQLPVFLQSRLLGAEALSRPVDAESAQQLVIDKAMLNGNFGGGILCDTAAHRFRFRQNIGYSGAVQQIGAQDARHTAPDNEDIGGNIPL